MIADSQQKLREFTVVLRGPAACVFWEHENFQITGLPTTLGSTVDAMYSTRWLDRETSIRIPGHLWVEIQGSGESLEQVMVPFANAALIPLPVISLAANAAIPEPDIELGFESTESVPEREYFQAYVPPESGVVHSGQHVNIEASKALLTALNTNTHSERLLRAANQYRLALEGWKMGRESMSLAHLWMGLEALTKVKIRKDCALLGLATQKELAEHLGVDLKDLDPTVRRTLLHNDEDCYTKSKAASDGMEHGFLGYDKIREYSKEMRHRMARYLRTAIFELSDLPKETKEILLNDPFDKPLGHWPLAKYIRGRLLGNGPTLAKEGNAYPFLRWNTSIKSCVPEYTGKLNVQFTENFTPELAQGLSFQAKSVEVWRPE